MDKWVFVVCDTRIGYTQDETGDVTGRPYSIGRMGCWIHIDDAPYILSLERPGCPCFGLGGVIVKPAYSRATATSEKLLEIPVN